MQYQRLMKLARRPPFSQLAGAAKTFLSLQHYVHAYNITQRSGIEKRDYLGWWQKATGCRIFIETGTCTGLTTLFMSNLCAHCYTVELDPHCTLKHSKGSPVGKISHLTSVTARNGSKTSSTRLMSPHSSGSTHIPAVVIQLAGRKTHQSSGSWP